MSLKDTYVQRCEDGKENIGGLLYTMPFGDNAHIVSHVWTNEKDGHRGHGHADQLMSQLTEDADRHGQRVYLQVGDGNPDMDLDRLSGLYKRHGFDWDDAIGGKAEMAMSREPKTGRLAATKKAPAKPKVRAPEDVWYDVHKHPEGVPGGMGRSPEYHLRNRGWKSHEIHGATNKTIQYHNPKHPDFVISYGGGSGTKPDHNFGITYLGTNPNIPKKHRAYSVADAMNKVEELHQIQAGHVVLPMTYGAAVTPLPDPDDVPDVPKTPAAPARDMDVADNYPDFPSQPTHTEHWRNPNRNYQLHQIPDPPDFRPKSSSWEAVSPANSMHSVPETGENWEEA